MRLQVLILSRVADYTNVTIGSLHATYYPLDAPAPLDVIVSGLGG